ncbi:MAG: hypothetical protein HYU48_00255 [Candidatus Levybacteria bacterium]|nr:hypothetical protein [Candidatus Levybacteria bacterium]
MAKRFGPLKNINKTNLNKLPDKPGVYGIYTNGGKLLKIGRAKQHRLSDRINENVNDIDTAKKFSVMLTKNVEDAKRLETKLIKSRKPPLNIEEKGK